MKHDNGIRVVEPDSDVTKLLVKAVECSRALDLPYREGKEVLEEHGWNEPDRFDESASQFVRSLQDDALEAYNLNKQ